MKNVSHLYVHIPFCATRCSYCDFYSNTDASSKMPEYVDRLLREAADTEDSFGLLETVYLGGGTPTLVGESLLERLLNVLSKKWAPRVEVTIEARPETIDRAMAVCLQNSGVTRVSLGVQSFDKEMRDNLGRVGDIEAIGDAVANLRSAGLDNIGLDLIFGIPRQDTSILKEDLQDAIALAPAHISCYELSYNIDSEYHRSWSRALGEVKKKGAHFYQVVVETLEKAGYGRYEVSNFARQGYECRHNISCWEGKDYIGLGAGAWSTVDNRRWHNTEDLKTYLEHDTDWQNARNIERVSGRMKLWEKVILGLRTTSGFQLEKTQSVIDKRKLKELGDEGLLNVNDGTVSLTSRGFFLADEVCSRILLSD